MLLDLWNSETLMHNFLNLYGLEKNQFIAVFRALFNDPKLDIISTFCEKTGFKLDGLDIADSIEFVGKIVSTTVDNFASLEQNGLLPIDKLLEGNTPISQHLKKFGVEIKPSSHTLVFAGKQYPLPSNNADCELCAYGDDVCRYSDVRNKNLHCKYRQAVEPLAVKLYSDRAQIELFLRGTKESMLAYPCVKNYPEIFLTIEELLRKLFGKRLDIGNEWSKQKQFTCIVHLPVRYNDMTYRSDYIYGTNGDAQDTFSMYEQYCNETYASLEDVPKCFWDNIWIIRACLEVIVPPVASHSDIYAGICHNIEIPYEQLQIEKID